MSEPTLFDKQRGCNTDTLSDVLAEIEVTEEEVDACLADVFGPVLYGEEEEETYEPTF